MRPLKIRQFHQWIDETLGKSGSFLGTGAMLFCRIFPLKNPPAHSPIPPRKSGRGWPAFPPIPAYSEQADNWRELAEKWNTAGMPGPMLADRRRAFLRLFLRRQT